MEDTSFKESLHRLMELCSKSEKCPRDIEIKLKQWGFNGDVAEVIETLKHENFIDPLRYARAFVNDKIKISKWGKQKVKFQLIGKGIDEKSIATAQSEFPESEYLEIISNELQKKNKALKETAPFKRKQKLLAFGMQRGFEVDILNSIVERLLG